MYLGGLEATNLFNKPTMKHFFCLALFLSAVPALNAQTQRFSTGFRAHLGVTTATEPGEQRVGSSITETPGHALAVGVAFAGYYRPWPWLSLRSGLGFSSTGYRQVWDNVLLPVDTFDIGTASVMKRTAQLYTLDIPLGVEVPITRWLWFGYAVEYGVLFKRALQTKIITDGEPTDPFSRPIEGLPIGLWRMSGRLEYRHMEDGYSIGLYARKELDQYEFDYFFTERPLWSVGLEMGKTF
jgi:hypothetical protein